MLDSGKMPSTTDLVRKLKLEPDWGAHVLRLTCLAPGIVAAILDGRQPRKLSVNVTLKEIAAELGPAARGVGVSARLKTWRRLTDQPVTDFLR